MPARVVTGGPADEPDVYVLVAVDRGVVPAPPGIGDLVVPQIRAAGQVLGEFGQFTLVEMPGRERGEVIGVPPLLVDGQIRPAVAASHPQAAAPGSRRGSHGGPQRQARNRDAAARTA